MQAGWPGVALTVVSRLTRNPEGAVYGIKERAERLSSRVAGHGLKATRSPAVRLAPLLSVSTSN